MDALGSRQELLARSLEEKNKILDFINEEKYVENLTNYLLLKADCSAGSVKDVNWEGIVAYCRFYFYLYLNERNNNMKIANLDCRILHQQSNP